jgi:hypothetical protein
MDLGGRIYPSLFTTYDDDDGGDVSVEDDVVGWKCSNRSIFVRFFKNRHRF